MTAAFGIMLQLSGTLLQKKNSASGVNTRTGWGSENHTVLRGAYNAPHRSQLL